MHSLVIIATDRRAYHVALRSTASTAMVALSWTYPADALLALNREAAEREARAPVAPEIAPERLRSTITGYQFERMIAEEDGEYIGMPSLHLL